MPKEQTSLKIARLAAKVLAECRGSNLHYWLGPSLFRAIRSVAASALTQYEPRAKPNDTAKRLLKKSASSKDR